MNGCSNVTEKAIFGSRYLHCGLSQPVFLDTAGNLSCCKSRLVAKTSTLPVNMHWRDLLPVLGCQVLMPQLFGTIYTKRQHVAQSNCYRSNVLNLLRAASWPGISTTASVVSSRTYGGRFSVATAGINSSQRFRQNSKQETVLIWLIPPSLLLPTWDLSYSFVERSITHWVLSMHAYSHS
jgi:hypothetical protein